MYERAAHVAQRAARDTEGSSESSARVAVVLECVANPTKPHYAAAAAAFGRDQVSKYTMRANGNQSDYGLRNSSARQCFQFGSLSGAAAFAAGHRLIASASTVCLCVILGPILRIIYMCEYAPLKVTVGVL